MRFPLLDDAGKPTDTSLLVWTTTPWTLPSNQFAAVHPDAGILGRLALKHGGKASRLIVASALVETLRNKVEAASCQLSTTTDQAPSSIGRAICRRSTITTSRPANERHAHDRAASSMWPGGWWPADFVTTDSGTGVVHQAPAFGEVDYDVLIEQQARFKDGRPAADQRRCVRRQVHRRCARLPRPLGQGCRQGDHPRPERSAALSSSRTVSARISVLLAGGRRSADPIPAAKLVHPHDAVQRRDAGQQRQDQLAAGAHQGRPVRQFSGNERRLGSFARALLGHAAADLDVPGDRQHGGRRQLRRAAGQARRARRRSLGSGEAEQSRTARRSANPQAVHRRITYDSPYATGARHAPRAAR